MRMLKLLPIALLFLLVPSPARAWGPAAHLDLGLAILRDLTLLAPAVAFLLARYKDDFLYGNLAADITIAKNLSPYQLHCHNWQVGFSVLDLATTDATRSFAWGYLSHLAADTVAHNYFVPYKTVENFRRRAASHTYWEIRFDTQIDQAVWEEGRRMSTRAFKSHDRHLRTILTGPLFPFRVNKQIFKSVVMFTRRKRWRRLAEAHARRTRRVLTDEEFSEARQMGLDRAIDLLRHGPQAECLRSDPTGHRNLLIARELRTRLRALHRQGRLLEPDQVGERFRPLFRQAIEAKLDLPSLAELTDPSKPEVDRRRARGLLVDKNKAGPGRRPVEDFAKVEKKTKRRVARRRKKAARKAARREKRTARTVKKAIKKVARKTEKAARREKKAAAQAARQAKRAEKESPLGTKRKSLLPWPGRKTTSGTSIRRTAAGRIRERLRRIRRLRRRSRPKE